MPLEPLVFRGSLYVFDPALPVDRRLPDLLASYVPAAVFTGVAPPGPVRAGPTVALPVGGALVAGLAVLSGKPGLALLAVLTAAGIGIGLAARDVLRAGDTPHDRWLLVRAALSR